MQTATMRNAKNKKKLTSNTYVWAMTFAHAYSSKTEVKFMLLAPFQQISCFNNCHISSSDYEIKQCTWIRIILFQIFTFINYPTVAWTLRYRWTPKIKHVNHRQTNHVIMIMSNLDMFAQGEERKLLHKYHFTHDVRRLKEGIISITTIRRPAYDM